MWHSADIHAYTPAIRARVPDANRSASAAVVEIDAPGIEETLADMKSHFKPAPAETAAIRNIENVLKNRPPDPQLPDLDLATCLRAVWWHARRRETDLLVHVAETLRWIGQTCPQGVSHRIVQDALVFF